MKNIVRSFTAIFLFFLSQSSDAQFLNNFKISNASSTPISLKGDVGNCVGQTDPHVIKTVERWEFDKLCFGTHCTVKIYSDFSCSSATEYLFDFNFEFGIGAITPTNPNYIKAEGFKDILFITKNN